jgi:acyl carrier protein
MIRRTSPSDHQLEQQVCSLVVRTLKPPRASLPVTVETKLYGRGLGVDSLDALRLVAALEEKFDVIIDDTDLTPATFESVGSIVSLIRRLKGSG